MFTCPSPGSENAMSYCEQLLLTVLSDRLNEDVSLCSVLMHLPLNLRLKVVVSAAVAEMLGSELGLITL